MTARKEIVDQINELLEKLIPADVDGFPTSWLLIVETSKPEYLLPDEDGDDSLRESFYYGKGSVHTRIGLATTYINRTLNQPNDDE